jgi:hypothetical protein
MPRLSAPVIAHDNTGLKMTGQVIGQHAFSGIPKAEIYNDGCAQRKDTPVSLMTRSLFGSRFPELAKGYRA